MTTHSISLTDTTIKKHLKARDSENITELRDTNSKLRLRINKARTGGTWFIVFYSKGKADWKKLGNFPELSYKDLLKKLSKITSNYVAKDKILNTRWVKVDGLLQWYLERVKSDSQITDKRKASVSSAITRHLSPKLGDVNLIEINRETIDERLIWPLQREYAVSYIMQIWGVMKAAFRRAHKLEMIESDPLASLRLIDFIKVKPKPKPAAIRPDYIPTLIEGLSSQCWPVKTLVLLMLLHGTRIGETRKAKWSDFDLLEGYWHLPVENVKTREALRLPLTDTAKTLLENHKASQRISEVYLFPGPKQRCISETRAGEIVRLASGGNWQAHDMRKLARTVWADLGVDYHIAERLLNHKLAKLDEVYIHTGLENGKREALEKYHNWLEIKGIKKLINQDNTKI